MRQNPIQLFLQHFLSVLRGGWVCLCVEAIPSTAAAVKNGMLITSERTIWRNFKRGIYRPDFVPSYILKGLAGPTPDPVSPLYW